MGSIVEQRLVIEVYVSDEVKIIGAAKLQRYWIFRLLVLETDPITGGFQ